MEGVRKLTLHQPLGKWKDRAMGLLENRFGDNFVFTTVDNLLNWGRLHPYGR
jgi:hypothetical protein